MNNFELTINGKKVSVDKIGKNLHGFSDVFVNRYSSCHKLPTHLIDDNSTDKNVSFHTGGNDYTITR